MAFGLFISSEYAWASRQPQWPSEEVVRESYSRLLYDYELQKTHDAAKKIVDDHREELVREHEKRYLEGIFQQIEQRVQAIVAVASTRSFWRGALEATMGAFIWMVILIIVVEGLRLVGIDVLHGLVNVGH